MSKIFAEIYSEDMKSGENEKGKFKEMPVFFNDQFGNQLGRDMGINGYVNEDGKGRHLCSSGNDTDDSE